MQSGTRAVHQELVAERDAALAAEGRIQALEKQIAEMSALMREDPLTHSLNRRGMDDEFARETARAERYKTAFSVAERRVVQSRNFGEVQDGAMRVEHSAVEERKTGQVLKR